MKVGDLVNHKCIDYLRCGVVTGITDNNYCYVLWSYRPILEVSSMLEVIDEGRRSC